MIIMQFTQKCENGLTKAGIYVIIKRYLKMRIKNRGKTHTNSIAVTIKMVQVLS